MQSQSWQYTDSPREAHQFARSLGGLYSSMDELEGKDLQTWAAKFDSSSGASLALAVIDFSSECMTSIGSELGTIRQRLQSNATNLSKGIRKNTEISLQLEEVIRHKGPLTILASFDQIHALKQCKLFRHELWWDMYRVLLQQVMQQETSLAILARAIRDQRRILGNSAPPKSVSRVLLVKGLELDHAVVLNAAALDAKQLYVAMTRGCRSLTVLSPSPIIQVEPAFNVEARVDASHSR